MLDWKRLVCFVHSFFRFGQFISFREDFRNGEENFKGVPTSTLPLICPDYKYYKLCFPCLLGVLQ